MNSHVLNSLPARFGWRLLAAAGYPGGKGLPKLEYLYNTSEGSQKAAEVYQETWRRELGIEVELKNQEWKVYLAPCTRGSTSSRARPGRAITTTRTLSWKCSSRGTS